MSTWTRDQLFEKLQLARHLTADLSADNLAEFNFILGLMNNDFLEAVFQYSDRNIFPPEIRFSERYGITESQLYTQMARLALLSNKSDLALRYFVANRSGKQAIEDIEVVLNQGLVSGKSRTKLLATQSAFYNLSYSKDLKSKVEDLLVSYSKKRGKSYKDFHALMNLDETGLAFKQRFISAFQRLYLSNSEEFKTRASMIFNTDEFGKSHDIQYDPASNQLTVSYFAFNFEKLLQPEILILLRALGDAHKALKQGLDDASFEKLRNLMTGLAESCRNDFLTIDLEKFRDLFEPSGPLEGFAEQFNGVVSKTNYLAHEQEVFNPLPVISGAASGHSGEGSRVEEPLPPAPPHHVEPKSVFPVRACLEHPELMNGASQGERIPGTSPGD